MFGSALEPSLLHDLAGKHARLTVAQGTQLLGGDPFFCSHMFSADSLELALASLSLNACLKLEFFMATAVKGFVFLEASKP